MLRSRTTFGILLALASGAWCQSREAAVQAALDAYVAKNRVVGASVAILERDGTLFATGSGFQDREANSRATGNTVYRLASISKPVTTVAALQLVEQNKLSLFADVRKAVPEWPDKGVAITLRHLLTHSSGIRHYVPSNLDRYFERFTVARSLDVFKADPLLFAPGTKTSYSTHAFSLVACMVEKGSGQAFSAYIRDHVSLPSGAKTLALEDRSKPLAARTKLYSQAPIGQSTLEKREEDLSWKSGGGGMESSAADLARFGMAALEGKLLGKQLTDFMFQNQIVDGLNTARGLGWSLPGGNPAHSGAQQGCLTLLATDRKAGRVWVVMTNTGGRHPIAELAASVAAAWKGVPPKSELPSRPTKP